MFVEEVSLDDLDHVTGDSVTPETAEDPTGAETVVIANQVGDPVTTGSTTTQLCGAFGGTPIVNEPRTGSGLESVTVVCDGGLLDGLVCTHEVGGSPGCYNSNEEDARVTVQPGPGEELEDAAGPGEKPAVAEDPTGAETVVIANQVGHPVDQAEMQKAFCRVAGGKAQGGEPTRNVQEGLTTAVGCKGGLLDGMTCANTATYSMCLFRGVVPEDPRVTPSGGIEVPTEDAPAETTVAEPTVAASDDPTEPTVAPTEVPVEPTAAPTEEPVLPTVPTDDNAVPPGEAEDPTNDEPAPTEAPLR